MREKAAKGDKREKIIGAAFRLFCQQGFQATSTALIAREAGVATGTLFLYFASKDVLINALYQEAKAGLTAHLRAGYPGQSGVGDRFRHLWFAACRWGLANPDAFRFMTMFCVSPYIWQVTRAEAASAAAFARQLVQEGLDTGVLQPIPADLLLALPDGAVTATVIPLAGTPGRGPWGRGTGLGRLLERRGPVAHRGLCGSGFSSLQKMYYLPVALVFPSLFSLFSCCLHQARNGHLRVCLSNILY